MAVQMMSEEKILLVFTWNMQRGNATGGRELALVNLKQNHDVGFIQESGPNMRGLERTTSMMEDVTPWAMWLTI